MQPPTQELVVRDLHDNTWTFRHIYRGEVSDICIYFDTIQVSNFKFGFLSFKGMSKILVMQYLWCRIIQKMEFCTINYSILNIFSVYTFAMCWILFSWVWPIIVFYLGQPKRHLLTTGWSLFVGAKRLKAGDAVLFIR